MIYKKLSLLILFFATGLLTASAQKSPQDMDRFIDALMKKMTTEEKIGQLNLPVTGEITTGQAKSSDIAGKIKKPGFQFKQTFIHFRKHLFRLSDGILKPKRITSAAFFPIIRHRSPGNSIFYMHILTLAVREPSPPNPLSRI